MKNQLKLDHDHCAMSPIINEHLNRGQKNIAITSEGSDRIDRQGLISLEIKN